MTVLAKQEVAPAPAAAPDARPRQRLSVADFGAVGDFDPVKGTGTDNRAAFQTALDRAAKSGHVTVAVPPGKYLIKPAWNDPRGQGLHLAIADATDVELVGSGAELFQGAPGRMLGVVNSKDVTIRGFKMRGFAGPPYQSSRERDGLIIVAFSSRGVTIENNDLGNSLGDCVYAGGSLFRGGEHGFETRDLTVRSNVMRERWGDGKRSYDNGQRSRTAMAVIDAVGITITGNKIFGMIDLEPNLDGQQIRSVRIEKNEFLAGPVEPVNGQTAPWREEQLVPKGKGTKLENDITLTGRPGRPVIQDVVVTGNRIESGRIVCGNVYAFDLVSDNQFTEGQIVVGNKTGSNHTAGVKVLRNTAAAPFPGEKAFVLLRGKVANSTFDGNSCAVEKGFCVADDGEKSGDLGRNVFRANVNRSAPGAGDADLKQGRAATSEHR